jgi:hypothetical protein
LEKNLKAADGAENDSASIENDSASIENDSHT